MREFTVTWSIQVEAETPREAAEKVWREQFNREWPPEPDSACVFVVAEEEVVDLEEPA